MNRLILFLSFLLICPVFGQEDPLLKKAGVYGNVRLTLRDSTLVTELNRIAKDSAYSNAEKSIQYARAGIKVSNEIEYSEGAIKGYLSMSLAKIYRNEIDSAMHFAEIALDLSERLGDKLLIIKSHDMKGSVYSYKGTYDKAVDEFFKAAKIAEKIDVKHALTSYANIGHVYKVTGNIGKSTEYCEKSLRLGKKYSDTSVMITAHNLLGLIDKTNGKPDDALVHFEKGLELARKSRNQKRQAEILYNMSNIYFNKQLFDKGFELFNESMSISKSNGSFRSIAIGYHSMAINYRAIGKMKESVQAADSALKYALRSNNFELIMESYAMEAQVHADMDELQDALTYLSYAYIYKDSLNLAQLNSAILDTEGQYEAEKKEMKAAMERAQEKKINQEKLWWRDLLLWISGLILVVVCVGIYLLFKSNRQIKVKNQTVELQKEEIYNQHKEIKDSILYAKRIQNALIGNEAEWRKLSESVSIFFRPRDVVSGDFYWVYNNMEKNLSIWAVADCTGHGVPGAFMSMLGVGFLNEIVIDNACTDPGDILDKLRSKIIHSLESEGNASSDGMDMAICVWNKTTNELEFAGANNGLWIIRNYEKIDQKELENAIVYEDHGLGLMEIAPDKMPIGHYFKVPPPFTTRKIQLTDQDTIILYSDGFADQFGGSEDKKFKYRQLKDLLVSMRANPHTDFEKMLEKTFLDWKGERDQTDDICIVSVTVSL